MTVYGQKLPCARAEKGADYVRAFDENGVCVFEATKVKSFEGYTLDGGEWGEPVIPPTNAELANSLASVQSVSVAAFVALAETQVLDDNTAAQHKDVFDEWAVGMSCKTGQLRRDLLTGLLYRCVQAHTAQEGWNPSLTPAMWTVVDVTHAGTLDDPIPAARGMEYEYGKHYLDPEDGAVYRCARTGEASGGKVTLQYLPHELVGQYFIAV